MDLAQIIAMSQPTTNANALEAHGARWALTPAAYFLLDQLEALANETLDGAASPQQRQLWRARLDGLISTAEHLLQAWPDQGQGGRYRMRFAAAADEIYDVLAVDEAGRRANLESLGIAWPS